MSFDSYLPGASIPGANLPGSELDESDINGTRIVGSNIHCPNINKIRRSLFRSSDSFDEERTTTKNTVRNVAQKSKNDSGFSKKYRDNSFAYYNRMFLSDSSDSESFDFADDDDWVPLVQLQRKEVKLVKRKINNANLVARKLTKRKNEPNESCSPIVKVSRAASGIKHSLDVNKKIEAKDFSSSNVHQGINVSQNITANGDTKTKDVEMISATMKFADLVFQFHNNVKLKMESDSEDDMTDISEADPEELE